MNSKEQVKKIQNAFNQKIRKETIEFITKLTKPDLSAILFQAALHVETSILDDLVE